jgi:DNA repair ATPase RecN
MNEQLQSAVSFLSDYGNRILKRKEQITFNIEKINKLKPAVEEFNRLKGEVTSLTAENKREEKFLLSMKDMIESHTDAKVQVGDATFFDQPDNQEKEG